MDKYDDEIAHRKETEERLVKAPDVKTVPVQKPESDPFFEKVAQKIANMFQHLTFDSESRYCIDYIMQGSEQDVENILREAFSEFSNLWQRIIVEQTHRADESMARALRAEAENDIIRMLLSVREDMATDASMVSMRLTDMERRFIDKRK